MRYVIGLVGGLLSAGAAQAGLSLELQDTPDIFSSFIAVTFDATTDSFDATGFALTLDNGMGPQENIANGGFSLTATIDDAGAASAGSLAISGEVLGNGPGLLTGDLDSFEFMPGGGDLLGFIFSVSGGDLAGLYGGIGAAVGVILDTQAAYSGDWTQSFTASGGVSDTAPVIPAPAAAMLPAICALGAARRRRS